MNLRQYLDETIVCNVYGFCHTCFTLGRVDRIRTSPSMHAIYRCPECYSINVEIYKVTEDAFDGSTIIIYEKETK